MSKMILVVEDEIAQLFFNGLSILGEGRYEIFIAQRGNEGVRKAKALNPDLIIMDLRLPGGSGLEAIKKIRKFAPTIPILAVTAYSDDFSREAAKDAGATEYMTKPFDVQDLLKHVQRLLGEDACEQTGPKKTKPPSSP